MKTTLKLKKRIVNPSFFQSESLATISPPARILFIGLWCAADAEGYIPYKLKVLHGLIFPYELNRDISAMLKELESINAVEIQKSDNKDIIWIPNFSFYQNKSANNSVLIKKEKRNTLIEVAKNVLADLNLKSGKRYKPSHDNTKYIVKHLSNGFAFEDFQKVNDIKVKSWSGTEFEKFLRPSTLYGSKFESYLNENGVNEKNGKNVKKSKRDELLAARVSKEVNSSSKNSQTANPNK